LLGRISKETLQSKNKKAYSTQNCSWTQVAATLSEFIAKIDSKTGIVEEKPKFLKTGDAAIVRIKPVRPLPIETFKEFPEIGRFALRDMGPTVSKSFIIVLIFKVNMTIFAIFI
jgi:translation elongation factor EF-1alpha